MLALELAHMVEASHARAYVLIASRRHTDLFEWAHRDIPFPLAAELQRRLLPSAYTAEGGSFTIAGWLEPAHDAGGDTFGYSVGSLRNSRRSLASPAEHADFADANLSAHARSDEFVTGLIIRIRLADGTAELVNVGPPPLSGAGRATGHARPRRRAPVGCPNRALQGPGAPVAAR